MAADGHVDKRVDGGENASLGEALTRFNRVMNWADPRHMWSMDSLSGMMQLDQIVNFQAAMIAYLDDFKLMMIVCLMGLPLLLLLKPTHKQPIEQGDTPTAAALD